MAIFKYGEGDRVSLKSDRPVLGLNKHDIGVIWNSYTTDPPAYEVTFRDHEGNEFDVTLSEDELKFPVPVVGAVKSGTSNRRLPAALGHMILQIGIATLLPQSRLQD